MTSCAAKQGQRNLRFYTKYGLRKEYAGIGNFMAKRSFIDLDYVYDTLSNSGGEYPVDYFALARNPMEFVVVATEAETGNAHYFDKRDISQDDYSIMKASSAIPFVCRPYKVRGVPYYDGAVADPVPVEKAFEMDCDRVVLLLTLPEDTVREPDKDQRLARGIRKRYPLSAAQGKVLIVAPDDICGVSTLKRNADNMRKLYEKGYRPLLSQYVFCSPPLQGEAGG